MLKFANNGILIEDMSELPNFKNAKRVFGDFETTSGDEKLDSLNPWFNCTTAGLAITVDDCPYAYYLPVAHHGYEKNLPKQAVADWWCDILDTCDEWENHNVKYDAHVSTNDLGVKPECKLRDTVTLSKIIDSDRIYKGGYGLDALSKYWLHEDISMYEQLLAPYLVKNKDYGWIPAERCGVYACQDVLTNRRLGKYVQERCPEECNIVFNNEIALTQVLFKMEQEGVHVDPQQLAITELLTYKRLMQLDEELEKIVGRPFRAHVNADCFDVLVNQYGLPIMAWTNDEENEDSDNASFDKYAMAAYLAYPYTPPGLIEKVIEYRQKNTFLNNFVKKFRAMNIDGVLHCMFNQAVRTGRLSCREPNMQQNNKESKALIIPAKGNAFASADESQIEFRSIVHYSQDKQAIAAFNEDPDTDYHQWVADEIHIKRKPAKTVNFAIAFGQGKDATIEALKANEDVMNELKEQVEELLAQGKIQENQKTDVYQILATRKGTQVYNTYHNTFPTIKATSKRADTAAKTRGYIRNLYGRRRHIPKDRSHIAFNALNQSTAADIIKEAMIRLAAALEGTPIKMLLQVHDELVFEGPEELMKDIRTQQAIVDIMEHPSIPMRVPLRAAIGVSSKSWRDASSDDACRTLQYPPNSANFLQTL